MFQLTDESLTQHYFDTASDLVLPGYSNTYHMKRKEWDEWGIEPVIWDELQKLLFIIAGEIIAFIVRTGAQENEPWRMENHD